MNSAKILAFCGIIEMNSAKILAFCGMIRKNQVSGAVVDKLSRGIVRSFSVPHS
jgi:hypothetical protein